ncbi:hypothetical protein [Nocardia sp. NPDC052566]|uniref:hypothetical protein n=1 Tax=Nocardia sp. NPDC052566 TaxID=3364330 RepID=UPI0037C5A256
MFPATSAKALLSAAAVATGVLLSAPAASADAAIINLEPTMRMDADTLLARGTAACSGGGQATVTVGGMISHRLPSPNMNPIALQMTTPVTVACDGKVHPWSAALGGSGRTLVVRGLGIADAQLTQGATVLADTGEVQILAH